MFRSFTSMKRIFLLLGLISVFHVTATSQVAIGEWRSHLPTDRFDWVGELKDYYFVANAHGVYKMDKRDNSITGLNKITGLSGTTLSSFECSKTDGVCIVGYSNGNIDVLTNGNVILNQRAILNAQTLGDKQVNGIEFIDGTALLSTGIGIIAMELSSTNILYDVSVTENDELIQFQEIELYNDSIYAITNTGIRSLPFSQLRAFNPNWQKLSLEANSDSYEHLFTNGTNLYVVAKSEAFDNDTLLVLRAGGFEVSDKLPTIGINSAKRYGDTLLMTHSTSIKYYSTNFEDLGTIFTFNAEGGMLPQSSQFVDGNSVIIADRVWGGVITSFENQYRSSFISSPSPNTADIQNVTILDETIYAFSGGNEFTYNQPLIHVLDDNSWESYSMITEQFTELRNINGIVSTDEALYYSMDGTGAAQLNASNLQTASVYTPDNSTVQDAQPDSDYDYLGITGIAADEDDNVWMLNNLATEPLLVRLASGTWASFDIGFDRPKTSELIQLDNGFLVAVMIDNGLLIYDFNGTPSDPQDDRYINLTSNPSQGSLPSNLVTAVAEDNNGELWIGTDAGVAVIYSPENVFNAGFEGAQQIIVNQDNYNGYLLETELVDAIAVDGADRKWLGTSTSGIFLVSPDGTRQIRAFTEENSPLLSDKIVDLDVHPVTGEVFISTSAGLISYRSDATESQSDLENMLIFPNPVRPEYSGPIAISNLFDGTAVRITNASGNLVHETSSLGGQATWDGTDVRGERVASGVYLVFAIKPDGTQGKVGKILMLN